MKRMFLGVVLAAVVTLAVGCCSCGGPFGCNWCGGAAQPVPAGGQY